MEREARRVTASEIRQDFSETVNRVAYSQEQFVIERRGRPMAALIPYKLYRRLQTILETIEDEMDVGVIAATAGEDLVDFDVAVKELDGVRLQSRDPKVGKAPTRKR